MNGGSRATSSSSSLKETRSHQSTAPPAFLNCFEIDRCTAGGCASAGCSARRCASARKHGGESGGGLLMVDLEEEEKLDSRRPLRQHDVSGELRQRQVDKLSPTPAWTSETPTPPSERPRKVCGSSATAAESGATGASEIVSTRTPSSSVTIAHAIGAAPLLLLPADCGARGTGRIRESSARGCFSTSTCSVTDRTIPAPSDLACSLLSPWLPSSPPVSSRPFRLHLGAGPDAHAGR